MILTSYILLCSVKPMGHLDYVVGTHAHEDHIGGLSGAFEAVTADMTLCPVTEYDSKAFRNFASYAEQKGGGITIPDVGETYTLGEAEFTIVGVNSVPDDTNNASVVLRIVYGDTSFLFTGDAEQEAENVILASGQDIQSTVLKVGHHGVKHIYLRGFSGCSESDLCCDFLWSREQLWPPASGNTRQAAKQGC